VIKEFMEKLLINLAKAIGVPSEELSKDAYAIGNYPEEGDICLYCKEGHLEYKNVTGCSCHISAPCSGCVDGRLVCDKCGEIVDEV
jgi:hypothetical protein